MTSYTLTATPSLMAAIPCGWQWLGWLTVIGLMVTACLPLGYSVTDTKEHNIFAADTYRKVFKMFRVGADRDMWLRHKGSICVDCNQRKVLYQD